ncbi:MAG: extracellular solute-binding protein [Bacteroidales bacterium]|nr:extracellular solute-binding protein [Bacteroidales bacterium]
MRKYLHISLLILLMLLSGCFGNSSDKTTVIVFHAGSLSVPIKEVVNRYEEMNPDVNIQLEGAGSVTCARKITELMRQCDIMISADYRIINQMLIPEYASWNAIFASNSMVVAYTDKSYRAGEIDESNWYEILLDERSIYGRADPDADPCGYRTLLTFKLAGILYDKPGIADVLAVKDVNMIRPKGVDLVALLEANVVDYIMEYRSVAAHHKLEYIELPPEINLSDQRFENLYRSVSVLITGSKPGENIEISGGTIAYGVTLLDGAPQKEEAVKFLSFYLSDIGLGIIEKSGQTIIKPAEIFGQDHIPEVLYDLLMEEKQE